VVAGLRRRRPAMDILTATQAGTLQLSDPAVLAWAQGHDRILLSHDQRTMPRHFFAFLAQLGSSERCPGVMLVPQDLGIGPAIEAVLEIWECSAHAEWRDLLVRLPL
jgi:hypothetical protein